VPLGRAYVRRRAGAYSVFAIREQATCPRRGSGREWAGWQGLVTEGLSRPSPSDVDAEGALHRVRVARLEWFPPKWVVAQTGERSLRSHSSPAP
jgi:hypothetical protein